MAKSVVFVCIEQDFTDRPPSNIHRVSEHLSIHAHLGAQHPQSTLFYLLKKSTTSAENVDAHDTQARKHKLR